LDEINVQVAGRLRRLRQSAGLSLEELARRSGVSRAMLSQIETLKTNPTIAVLWRIAQGLEVSFAELLGDDEPPPAVRLERAAEARYLFSEDGSFRSRPLLSQLSGQRVELYELRLAAGTQEPARPHPPGSHEQLYVQRGRLGLGLEQGYFELAPRDALLFPADQAHRYEALGDEDFEGLSLIVYAS